MTTDPDFIPAGEELDAALLQIVYGLPPWPGPFDPYLEYSPSTRLEDARKMRVFFGDYKARVLEPKDLPEIKDPIERQKRRPPWRVEFTQAGDEAGLLGEDLFVAAEGETEAVALTRALIKLHARTEGPAEV